MRERGTEGGGGSAPPFKKSKNVAFLLLSQIRAKKNYTFGTKISITVLFLLTWRYFYVKIEKTKKNLKKEKNNYEN